MILHSGQGLQKTARFNFAKRVYFQILLLLNMTHLKQTIVVHTIDLHLGLIVELRRLRQDLIIVYKILFGLTGDTCSNFFVLADRPNAHDTRGHEYKLYPAFSCLDVHTFFFMQRIIKQKWISCLQNVRILLVSVHLKHLFVVLITIHVNNLPLCIFWI